MNLVVNRKRLSRPDERGSTLLMAIVAVTTMSLIFAAIAAYASVNQKTVSAYREVRETRYAGETAVNAAINWAQDTYNVGRDPLLSTSDPDCVVHTPTAVGTITSSCAAEAGSESGKPAQGGLIPEEALVLLGDRTPEPGPFNREQCQGWWDTFTGWFSSGVDPNATGPGEYSAWFRVRKGLGAVQATCNTNRTRKIGQFDVQGDVAAAGTIVVDSGGSSVSSVGSLSGTVTARRGCSGPPASGVAGCGTPGNRTDGSPKDSDPGRPVNPAVTPVGPSGDIKEAWLPVGFNANGSVRSGVSLPVRTKGYIWNPATGALNAVSTCSGVSTTIVFLPGWYTKAHTLNQFTTSAACDGVTFWFAPDPGPDNLLLTDDDTTGAFYMDFRSGPAVGCNGMPVNGSRWCIGGSSSNNIRVVTGVPKDWGPLGAAPLDNPAGDTRTRLKVEKNAAGTVDSGLSQIWHNGDNAKTLNGVNAYYSPCTLLFITCPSIDRAIRLRNFTPKATSPPIDDPGLGFPNGRIYVEIRYGLYNATDLNAPVLEINAVSNESGNKSCGSFTLPKLTYSGSGALPAAYRFTDAEAKQLADACSSVDLINGYEFTLKVSGDPFNTPWADPPKVYLDGARFEYDTFQGANFPNPAAGSGSVAAQSDCDDTTPGAQLIFGGESHVYVADGSLEICGGPYPVAPENHQVVGLYGVPAVASIPVQTVSNGGGNGMLAPVNPNNAKKIDGVAATIQYGSCHAFCGASYEEGRLNLKMAGYSAPSGYEVTKVEARVSYNPKNQGCFFLWSCPGAEPQLRTPSCNSINLPKNPDRGNLQVASLNQAPDNILTLYEKGGRQCFTLGALASGVDLVWAARAKCAVWICIPLWRNHWDDELDGVELSITLAPTDTTKPYLIPQSGCIVAHPNYGGGEGQPDCALLRADTGDWQDNWTWPWAAKEGQWRGRASVKGTIYAPSSAMEIDDTDYAYALATRGAVLRHLRVSGWGERSGYAGPAVTNDVDKTPTPRVATFTACTQTATRVSNNEPCDAASDTIITRALVRFDTDPDWVDQETNARVPRIDWWATEL